MKSAVSAASGKEMCAKGIKAALQPVFEQAPVVTAYLYGSQAKGVATEGSDVNLAVLVHPEAWEAGHDPHQEIHAHCCKVLERDDVDVVVLNRMGDLHMLNEITRSGMVLVDEDPAMRSEFEGKVLDEYVDCVLHREKR